MSIFKSKAAKAKAAEVTARKASARKEIREFIAFCNSYTEGKDDYEIDWLNFAYAYYERFYILASRYPELDDFTGWGILSIGPIRKYNWFRDDAGWGAYTYAEMKECQDFVESNGLWKKYERYYSERYPNVSFSLDLIPLSGGYEEPGSYCAYFSFAKSTKSFNSRLCARLLEF